MASKFSNVLSYFGESESRTSHEFFSLLNNFVRDFELSPSASKAAAVDGACKAHRAARSCEGLAPRW